MQIIVKTSDIGPNVNFTEGGFDNFFLDSIDHYKINEEPNTGFLAIFPNPTRDEVIIRAAQLDSEWKLIDVKGKVIYKFKINLFEEKVNLINLQNGIYFLKSNEAIFKIIKI
jgi:hypothetical protein